MRAYGDNISLYRGVVENQRDKSMDNDMESGIMLGVVGAHMKAQGA